MVKDIKRRQGQHMHSVKKVRNSGFVMRSACYSKVKQAGRYKEEKKSIRFKSGFHSPPITRAGELTDHASVSGHLSPALEKIKADISCPQA